MFSTTVRAMDGMSTREFDSTGKNSQNLLLFQIVSHFTFHYFIMRYKISMTGLSKSYNMPIKRSGYSGLPFN